jgi:hypothetical protein
MGKESDHREAAIKLAKLVSSQFISRVADAYKDVPINGKVIFTKEEFLKSFKTPPQSDTSKRLLTQRRTSPLSCLTQRKRN